MAEIPLASLTVGIVLDNSKVLTALKEVEQAVEKTFKKESTDTLERALQGLATAAKEANARLDPLAKQAQLTLREMQNLANAVKAGAAEIQSSLQRYRELEAILKGQVAVLDKAGAGYLGIAKDMKAAGDEGKKLESLNKSLTASYKTEDLTRYGRGLLDIVQAQKAGVTSQTQAISQLKSYQSALAQQTGALEKNSAEYKSVIKAMGDTGTAIKKLEADADKLTASFRSDELSRYAGEFKQIDAAVKSGTDGFENASTRVQKLSAELKEQQAALTNTGREFDQFSRLLKEAAAQQERYQTAAEKASRANDAAQIRTYGTELKQLEGTLRNTTAELGRLDSQQRALKYDSGAVSQYRGEQERLSGSFDGLGRGLEGLRGKLQDYARGLSEGSSEHKELVRVMDATERATQSLTREQERAAQAYRGAEIEQFTARLRDVEKAQKSNLTSTEQAARAVQQIQTEFKDYAAALGIAERELDTFSRLQIDAGRSADTFAGAQERAARAFDASALRSFVGELQNAVQAYDKGGIGAEGFTRAVSDSQSRLREYGSTLNQNSREFADFNKLLDVSERALLEVGTTAERTSRAFDAGPVRVYSTELKDLQSTGRELGTAFSGIEGELNKLDTSLRDSGQAANLSVRELTALQNVERELEGATTRLVAEQSKLEAAFRVDALKTFRSDLEQIVTANKNGVTSFDQTARAIEALQGRLREFANSTTLSANEQRTLASVMGQTESAATRLATAQQRAGDAFQAENVRQQVAALNELKLALERGDISQEQFSVSARGIGVALEQSRSGLDNSTRAYANYTTGLTRVESSLAQAEGRVRTFGVASGVTAGVSDQLQNVLYRLGPAGEAMGVAMFSASAGMTGASLSAKALNIALTVGVVGAIIGAAVATKALFDRAGDLNDGLVAIGKTTGLTQDQLGLLQTKLQGISTETGTGVLALQEYAAVAGQLGIKGADNIAGFVDIMNKLGIATDIVGEEGAQQLATFVGLTKDANVSITDSANLVGNVITELGNNLRTTEAPILALASRLTGLSTSAGASQTEILGMAGALASLGFSAEAGGESTVRIFNIIVKAVDEGGAALDKFAAITGLTSEEFAKLFKENPVEAFYQLTGGIKEASDSGESLVGIYADLGFSGSENIRVLDALVGGYEDFGLSLKLARAEAEDLNALQTEVDAKLKSLNSTVTLIGSAFGFLGDKMALAVLPVFQGLLNNVLDFSRGLAGLEPIMGRSETLARQIGISFAQFGAGIAGIGGAIVGVGQSIKDTYATISTAIDDALDTKGMQAFQAENQKNLVSVDNFVRGVFGLPPATDAAADSIDGLATSQNEAADSAAKLGTAEQEQQRAIDNMGKAYSTNKAEVQAYVDRLNAALQVYPQLEAALRPLISQGEAQIEVLNRGGQATVEAANKLGGLTGAQEKYNGLQNLSTEQAQQFLNQLKALRTAYPHVAQEVNVLIAGVEQYIKTQGEAGEANQAQEGSLLALREERQRLVEIYENSPIGSAAQAEALQAIRAIDSQIEAGDRLAANIEEIGRTAADMANNIVSSFQRGEISSTTAINALTAKLAELKQQKADTLASGDYDAADLQKFDEDIAAVQARLTEATTAAANFRDGVTEYDNAQREANKSIQAVSTIFAQQRVLIEQLGWSTAAQNVNLYADAQDASEAAIRANTDAAFAQEAAQRGLNKTIADGLTVFHQQTTVLEQLGLAIATDQTNTLAAAQAEAARAAAEASDSWRVLKETQDGYTSSSTLTISQTNTLADVMGTVRNALQEAENAFTITGDAAKFNADKTGIYQGALETLYRAGIDPATVGLQGWVTALQESEDKTQAQAEAVERAKEAAERYAENLKTTRDAQQALGDASGIATEDIADLISSLDTAAEGTGRLSEQARQTQEDLRALALARDVASTFDEIGAAADRALADIPGLSDQARGGLQALSDASKGMSKALSDGVVTPSEGIAVLGAGIDALAEGFRDDLSPAAYAGVKAIDDIAQVALKAASGDYIGAAIAALGGLLNAFIDFVSESKREMQQFTDAMTGSMDALDSAIDQSIDNMRQLAENDLATGALDELSFNIINTQLDLIENQRQVNDDLADVALRRREALQGITDPDDIALINDGFDAEETAIREGGELNADAIVQGGIDTALAAGQSTEDFIAELESGNSGVAGSVANGSVIIGDAIDGYAEDIGNDWDNAGSEMRESMEAALQDQIDSFNDATDEWENSLLDSRIRLAKAQGASDIEILILETNAKILDAHQSFMDDMADLETDKEDIIRAYILANPGISREEAEAYAESIVAPGRDALEENYANTSAAILLESQTQAEELGLSEREYWKAVIEGNQEVLGDMTEEQRLALLDFIATAREYGIELPGYLEDMYNEVYGAHTEGGARVSEGAEQGNAEHMAALSNIESQLRAILGPAADEIIALINETYEGQQAAHTEGGAEAGQAAETGNQSQLAALDNIYAQLRALLGPAADEIIGLIQATYDGQSGAYEEGSRETAAGIDAGAETEAQALTDRENTLQGLLERSDLTPALRESAKRLQDEFISGANMTAAEIAAGREKVALELSTRNSRIEELVRGGMSIADATRQVDGEIAATFDSMTGDVTNSVNTSGTAIGSSITDTVSKITGVLNGDYAGMGNTVGVASRIFTAAISASGNDESQAFTTQGSAVSGTVGNISGNITSAIGSLYGDVTGGLSKGSSEMVSQIQRAYEAEQSKFSAESAVFERLIASAKGDEKATLQREYDALKREHEADSRDYQNQIDSSAKSEQSAISGAEKLLSGALGAWQKSISSDTDSGYRGIGSTFDNGSREFRSIIDKASGVEKSALSSAVSTVTGALGKMRDDVIGKTNSTFSDQGDAYKTGMDKYIGIINDQETALQRALGRIADVIKNFKYPKLPTPPTPSSSGYAGEAPVISPVDFMPSIGAFAADGFLPDYSYATSGALAYAAATTGLLDLFGPSRTLALSSKQERALSLNITFSGLKDSFAAPVAGMERASSLMMNAARLQFDAAERFAAAVEKMATNAAGSTLEWSRRPRRR